MTFQFTRNLPANLSDEADVQSKLQGLISEETRLSMLSVVPDPKAELQKMKEEEVDSIDLDTVHKGGENDGMGQEAETPPKIEDELEKAILYLYKDALEEVRGILAFIMQNMR